MNFLKYFQTLALNIKKILKDNTHDSVLSIVNTVPTLAGFSFHKEKLSPYGPFWIFHFFLLFYVYGVGSSVYLAWHAHGNDYVKSVVNISIALQVTNISDWWRRKRPLLKAVLDNIKLNDELAKASPETRAKHRRRLSVTKYIVLTFYAMNHINAYTSYIPSRVHEPNEFAMVPCVGMNLNRSPAREICTTLLAVQEITVMVVALNYQALIIFLISHTATMYHLLSDDIMSLYTAKTDDVQVKEKLAIIIKRHVLTLDIVDKFRKLYSTPLGVNFGSNAVCIAFFFYMSLEEMMTFMPIMMYCFLVFFLYCFLCQSLVNAAEIFARSVYSCGWENFQSKEMKMVYVMLLLAQKEVELLAADIIPVNIYTFAVTLQSMFKFVTVMKF